MIVPEHYSVEVRTGFTGVPRVLMEGTDLGECIEKSTRALRAVRHRIGDGPFRILISTDTRTVSGTINPSTATLIWDEHPVTAPLPITQEALAA